MSKATATVAFWLPCGPANFLRAADDPLVAALTVEHGAEWPRIDLRQWATLGVSQPTASSSLVTRAVWAVISRGWDARARLDSTRYDDETPERLTVRAEVDTGMLTLAVDADGLHRWSLAGGDSDALALLVEELLGTPDKTADGSAVDWYGGAAGGWHGDVYVEPDDDGYLPFFQLNLLFGGLFNPAFVPAMFLEATDAAGDELQPLDLVELIGRLSVRDIDPEKDDSDVRAEALRRFLAITFESSLGPLKWRLERVRRAFLGSMLGLIHRKAPLTQLRERLSPEESFDDANEPQLRGYVMLVSSKLALLQNVLGHIQAIKQQLGTTEVAKDVGDRCEAWEAMLTAISNNVAGLEGAVHHAWMDRMLYEQEQARAEQEALAEIERIRIGEGRGGGAHAEALFAGVALFPALAGIAGSSADIGLTPIALVIGVGGTVLALCGLLAFHLWTRWKRGDAHVFYELNLRLDVHVPPPEARRLLRLDDQPTVREGEIKVSGMRRGAVRIERISDDDAIYKIHFDGKVTLPKDGWAPRRKVPIHAICELLHHRPSATFEYIFRELRVICPDGAPLNSDVLLSITTAIAELLVDPHVSGESLSERIASKQESSTIIFQRPDREREPAELPA